ncbi:SDR family NAD(P)-dependent oxidoreductase [Ningiella sp. W23]|uniref:SDR family NAD(P)-dependent oxidoreductase n=1 Tax=Ningiella sp. W23 TaxID=3023715 RepID=UPI003757CC3C
MINTNFKDKIALVTGATNGMGKIMAIKLAESGAEVVIVGRDKLRTEQTANEIKQQVGHNNVHSLIGNLSLMADVKDVAERFKDRFDHLDFLINNAGIIPTDKRVVTSEGIESSFAINHLAPFLLTNLLTDHLKASKQARVLNMASEAHGYGKIDFDNLHGEKSWSPFFGAYTQSKLALVLTAYKFAQKFENTNVAIISADPGGVQTRMTAKGGGAPFFVTGLLKYFFPKPEAAVGKLIEILSLPNNTELNGSYFIKGKRKKSAKQSYDKSVGNRLWEVSSNLVNL